MKESLKKVKDWTKELEAPDLTKEDRHSIMNKKSALESRIAKRKEMVGLRSKVVDRRARFE